MSDDEADQAQVGDMDCNAAARYRTGRRHCPEVWRPARRAVWSTGMPVSLATLTM